MAKLGVIRRGGVIEENKSSEKKIVREEIVREKRDEDGKGKEKETRMERGKKDEDGEKEESVTT